MRLVNFQGIVLMMNIKKKHKKKYFRDAIYRAICLYAAFPPDHSVAVSIPFDANQDVINGILQIATRYKEILEMNKKVDLAVSDLPSVDRPLYPRMIIDETQGVSLNLFNFLLTLSESCVVFMDPHQSLLENAPNLELFYKLLQQKKGPGSNFIYLTSTFRNPYPVVKVSNEILKMMHLCEGISPKSLPESTQKREGRAQWRQIENQQDQETCLRELQCHLSEYHSLDVVVVIPCGVRREDIEQLFFGKNYFFLYPSEVIGLEFPCVVAWNPLYDDISFLKDVSNRLSSSKNKQYTTTTIVNPLASNRDADTSANVFFQRLYMIVTRATTEFIGVQTKLSHGTECLLEDLKSAFQGVVSEVSEADSSASIRKMQSQESSQEGYRERFHALLRQDNPDILYIKRLVEINLESWDIFVQNLPDSLKEKIDRFSQSIVSTVNSNTTAVIKVREKKKKQKKPQSNISIQQVIVNMLENCLTEENAKKIKEYSSQEASRLLLAVESFKQAESELTDDDITILLKHFEYMYEHSLFPVVKHNQQQLHYFFLGIDMLCNVASILKIKEHQDATIIEKCMQEKFRLSSRLTVEEVKLFRANNAELAGGFYLCMEELKCTLSEKQVYDPKECCFYVDFALSVFSQSTDREKLGGFINALILYEFPKKMRTDYSDEEYQSIIQLMVSIFLKFSSVTDEELDLIINSLSVELKNALAIINSLSSPPEIDINSAIKFSFVYLIAIENQRSINEVSNVITYLRSHESGQAIPEEFLIYEEVSNAINKIKENVFDKNQRDQFFVDFLDFYVTEKCVVNMFHDWINFFKHFEDETTLLYVFFNLIKNKIFLSFPLMLVYKKTFIDSREVTEQKSGFEFIRLILETYSLSDRSTQNKRFYFLFYGLKFIIKILAKEKKEESFLCQVATLADKLVGSESLRIDHDCDTIYSFLIDLYKENVKLTSDEWMLAIDYQLLIHGLLLSDLSYYKNRILKNSIEYSFQKELFISTLKKILFNFGDLKDYEDASRELCKSINMIFSFSEVNWQGRDRRIMDAEMNNISDYVSAIISMNNISDVANGNLSLCLTWGLACRFMSLYGEFFSLLTKYHGLYIEYMVRSIRTLTLEYLMLNVDNVNKDYFFAILNYCYVYSLCISDSMLKKYPQEVDNFRQNPNNFLRLTNVGIDNLSSFSCFLVQVESIHENIILFTQRSENKKKVLAYLDMILREGADIDHVSCINQFFKLIQVFSDYKMVNTISGDDFFLSIFCLGSMEVKLPGATDIFRKAISANLPRLKRSGMISFMVALRSVFFCDSSATFHLDMNNGRGKFLNDIYSRLSKRLPDSSEEVGVAQEQFARHFSCFFRIPIGGPRTIDNDSEPLKFG